jgi:hypothetical protein
MFAVDEATAHAIRQACQDGGELSGVVELRRHFPLIADNARARLCLEVIMSWVIAHLGKGCVPSVRFGVAASAA